MKTMLLKRIHKLGRVAYKEYERNPKRVGKKWSTDWCDHDKLQMEDAEFTANFRLSRPSFTKLKSTYSSVLSVALPVFMGIAKPFC